VPAAAAAAPVKLLPAAAAPVSGPLAGCCLVGASC
jgi:hypothetical protein